MNYVVYQLLATGFSHVRGIARIFELFLCDCIIGIYMMHLRLSLFTSQGRISTLQLPCILEYSQTEQLYLVSRLHLELLPLGDGALAPKMGSKM